MHQANINIKYLNVDTEKNKLSNQYNQHKNSNTTLLTMRYMKPFKELILQFKENI